MKSNNSRTIRLARLKAQGFDQSVFSGMGTHIKIGCSQCAAMTVNGVACHEHGCPNQTHECTECETLIGRGQRLCEDCAGELAR